MTPNRIFTEISPLAQEGDYIQLPYCSTIRVTKRVDLPEKQQIMFVVQSMSGDTQEEWVIPVPQYNFLVTTHAEDIPEGVTIAVDGTVPGWQPKEGDYLFDHHRPGGSDVQIMEIPNEKIAALATSDEEVTFVTPMLDADACVAAAWIILGNGGLTPHYQTKTKEAYDDAMETRNRLLAIAYDCDHLGLPLNSFWDGYRCFARNAVAAMRISSENLAKNLGLPEKKVEWTRLQRRRYYSENFRINTQRLVDAAVGLTSWPGEQGEAEIYWRQFENERPRVYPRCKMSPDGFPIFDSRGFDEYIDPRHLIEWTRKQPKFFRNITLTVRDRSLFLAFVPSKDGLIYWRPDLGEDNKLVLPAYGYTIGSVPMHPDGSPKFADKKVFDALTSAEEIKRQYLGFPLPRTGWGGRNEAGGSPWNDASILVPSEVLRIIQMVDKSLVANEVLIQKPATL